MEVKRTKRKIIQRLSHTLDSRFMWTAMPIFIKNNKMYVNETSDPVQKKLEGRHRAVHMLMHLEKNWMDTVPCCLDLKDSRLKVKTHIAT